MDEHNDLFAGALEGDDALRAAEQLQTSAEASKLLAGLTPDDAREGEHFAPGVLEAAARLAPGDLGSLAGRLEAGEHWLRAVEGVREGRGFFAWLLDLAPEERAKVATARDTLALAARLQESEEWTAEASKLKASLKEAGVGFTDWREGVKRHAKALNERREERARVARVAALEAARRAREEAAAVEARDAEAAKAADLEEHAWRTRHYFTGRVGEASVNMTPGSTVARWESQRGEDKVVALAHASLCVRADVLRQLPNGPPQRSYTYSACCEADGRPGPELTFTVPAEELGRFGDVLRKHVGPAMRLAPGRDVAELLRSLADEAGHPVPRLSVYGFTGWHSLEGEPVYLHAGGALGAQGPVEGVTVDLDAGLAAFTLPAPPVGERRTRAVRWALDFLRLTPASVAVPLCLAAFAAALGMRHLALYVTAPPESGKSEWASLAQRFFGRTMDRNHLPIAVRRMSETGALLVLSPVGDALVVADDFELAGTHDDEAMTRTLDRVVRAVFDGTTDRKARRNRTAAEALTPRSALVVTGSNLPAGHSLRTRMLVLELLERAACSDLGPLSEAAAKGALAECMAAFLRWHAPRREEFLRGRDARLRAYVEAHPRKRTAGMLAQLAVAAEELFAFALEAGALTSAEREELTARVGTTLDNAEQEQAEQEQQENPARRFLEVLRDVFASGEAHAADLDGHSAPEDPAAWGWAPDRPVREYDEETRTASSAPGWRPQGKRVAFVDPKTPGTLFLLPRPALAVVRSACRALGHPFPLTAERELSRALHKAGLLAATDLGNSRKSYAKRKRAGTPRYPERFLPPVLWLRWGDDVEHTATTPAPTTEPREELVL